MARSAVGVIDPIDEPMPHVFLIQVKAHEDERGSFLRLYCRDQLSRLGFDFEVVQANLSTNPKKGTLRGLHYQLPPSAETKLVWCLRGSVWDCVLDLRATSPTFGKWVGYELSATNRRAVLVPPGCAHGFLTLEPNVVLFYLVSARYDPARERGIRWNDPFFAIAWPFAPALVSPRDRAHPDFEPGYHLGCAENGLVPCVPL